MVSLMRRKHTFYIIITAILSTVSFAIVITSFLAKDWIRAIAKPKIEGGPQKSNINYGLFTGTLLRRPVYSPYEYDISFTCIWSENACAWSCADDEEARKKEVQNLINGNTPSWICKPKSTSNFANNRAQVFEDVTESKKDRIFINAGLWVAIIFFLAVLPVAIFASIILSVINCLNSPIQTYLNLRGIYITNGIALVANFFVLLLYGICYNIYIKEDISIFDTIVGDYKSEASLGYCYWLLLVPFIFEGVGIFVIAMREKMINSDRAEMKIDVSVDVPETGVLF